MVLFVFKRKRYFGGNRKVDSKTEWKRNHFEKQFQYKNKYKHNCRAERGGEGVNFYLD